MSTIFAQIIQGKLPADKVFEDEDFLVIKDIQPVAPVHLLLIPKKEIVSLQFMEPADLPLMGKAVALAQQLAQDFDIEKSYRLLSNHGSEAGQTVFHLHFHLIGGRKLGSIG